MTDTKLDVTSEVKKLFEINAHIGHRKNRLHPKARKYIYKMINGIAIIDLTKTVDSLTQAKIFLKKQAASGQVMLVVATKKLANQFVTKACDEASIPYITNKWLPGLLTNFETINKNVKKLITMQEDKQNGAWDKFVKHEIARLEKEIGKLKRLYNGIVSLPKRPDFIFVVDIRKEKNALLEARQYNLPIVAVLDTNSNPDLVQYPVVANDDASSSLDYLIHELLGAYISGVPTKKTAVVKKV